MLLGLSLLMFSSISCSEQGLKLHPVKGKVTFDGKPPEGAVINVYITDPNVKLDRTPTATVQADGSFTIGTFEPGDGAPAGKHGASIWWYPPGADKMIELTGTAPNKLPARYGSPKTSGIEIEVKEGDNEIPPIELTSKK
jgi:hypothetical protein